MIEEALFDAEEKMEKAVSVAKDDLGTIRTGRANPGMFSRIVVDYYGSPTPITQMSSITVPEPRLVVIKPYEANQLGPIETAIRNSDLGVNPTNNGDIIRISVPQLTEERRRELAKQAKGKGRTPRSPSATSGARPWTSCRASRKMARRGRTRSGAPRRNSTRPPPSMSDRSMNW